MDKVKKAARPVASSSGHKLGQIVGDWYEEYVALPILQEVAERLGLYCDSRFNERNCRGEKIIWLDYEKNEVDYDFVLELNGSNDAIGVPVAAFETFWRRGSRHSKDKARDDTGKLMPLKYTYPTMRILGIISAGDFTQPAKVLVTSRGVDLFYVDKENILSAWKNKGLIIDYPDKSTEATKAALTKKVTDAVRKKPEILKLIAEELIRLINPLTIKSYQERLISSIGAIPQRFSIQIQTKSEPFEFQNYLEADDFFNAKEPVMEAIGGQQSYSYQVQFFDGDEFQRDNLSWEEIKKLHANLKELISHLENI